MDAFGGIAYKSRSHPEHRIRRESLQTKEGGRVSKHAAVMCKRDIYTNTTFHFHFLCFIVRTLRNTNTAQCYSPQTPPIQLLTQVWPADWVLPNTRVHMPPRKLTLAYVPKKTGLQKNSILLLKGGRYNHHQRNGQLIGLLPKRCKRCLHLQKSEQCSTASPMRLASLRCLHWLRSCGREPTKSQQTLH